MASEGDYLRKVAPGETLEHIPRDAYNAFVETAQALRGGRIQGRAGTPRQTFHVDIIPIRNDTGDDLPRFSVLQLGSPLVSPADNLPEYQSRPALAGLTPDDQGGAVCVLLEPAQADAIVPGLVAGVTAVLVDRTDDGMTCEATPGQTEYLRRTNDGPIQILWLDDDPDPDPDAPARDPELYWAYVLLQGAGSSCLSGSPYWTSCRKRVIAVRCVDGELEYDAEFDYYDCHGRLLFTSDAPCYIDDEGEGGGDPVPVTVTIDYTPCEELHPPEDCELECDDCGNLAGAWNLDPQVGGGWYYQSDLLVCGSPLYMDLVWDTLQSCWVLTFYSAGTIVGQYESSGIDEDWDGSTPATFTFTAENVFNSTCGEGTWGGIVTVQPQ